MVLNFRKRSASLRRLKRHQKQTPEFDSSVQAGADLTEQDQFTPIKLPPFTVSQRMCRR
jgi:hypothetical protein